MNLKANLVKSDASIREVRFGADHLAARLFLHRDPSRSSSLHPMLSVSSATASTLALLSKGAAIMADHCFWWTAHQVLFILS